MEVLDRIKQAEDQLTASYQQNQLKAEMRSKLVDTAAQSQSKLNAAQVALEAAQQEFDEAHATIEAYDGKENTAAEPTVPEDSSPLEPAA